MIQISKRERKIVSRKEEGASHADIARSLNGISPERVRQLYLAARRKLACESKVADLKRRGRILEAIYWDLSWRFPRIKKTLLFKTKSGEDAVRELLLSNRDEVSNFSWMGPRQVEDLEKILAEYNFCLGMTEEEISEKGAG
ncbi:MAG: hypothetical protein AAB655_01260 [Patescibacteria group bacterium]